MIAPHILLLSSFLTIMWGIYLIFTIKDYRRVRLLRVSKEAADNALYRRKGDTVAAFRRMIVAFCVFTLPASFVFRTACVLLGVGDETTAQITFFALVGPNVVGSIFAVVSLAFDG